MPDFTNQYLLTKTQPTHSLPKPFVEHEAVAGYAVHASQTLPVAIQDAGATTVAVLGDILDPRQSTATNGDIAARLCQSDESVLAALQRYSGRFVVVVATPERTVVIPDAGCLRRVCFTDDAAVVTSSPQLFCDVFGFDPTPRQDVGTFLDSDAYAGSDINWPGPTTIDRRLTELTPNQYLDVEQGVSRRPLAAPDVATHEDVRETIITALRGGLEALTERYSDVRPAVTAGWDSRLILAAAETVADRCSFRTFATGAGIEDPDIQVPFAIAERVDLDYCIVKPRPLTEEFAAVMQDNYADPRLTADARYLQSDYRHATHETAHVSGLGAEIMRTFYGQRFPDATPEHLAALYGYPDSAFARDELAAWLPSAKAYAERTGIDIYDLFYWEQRVANWGARAPYERDIATHAFTPFNNYNLLLSGLSVPADERTAPNYLFFEELVREMWPEMLEFPINPEPPKNRIEKVEDRLRYAAKDYRAVYELKEAYQRIR